MIPSAQDAAEVATTIAEYGNDITLPGGATFRVIADENQGDVAKTFPYEDLSTMGRTALWYLDGSPASISVVKSAVLTDPRTGIRWLVEAISDEAFGGILYCRIALMSADPMSR